MKFDLLQYQSGIWPVTSDPIVSIQAPCSTDAVLYFLKYLVDEYGNDVTVCSIGVEEVKDEPFCWENVSFNVPRVGTFVFREVA